jgi:hypothetical protein
MHRKRSMRGAGRMFPARKLALVELESDQAEALFR